LSSRREDEARFLKKQAEDTAENPSFNQLDARDGQDPSKFENFWPIEAGLCIETEGGYVLLSRRSGLFERKIEDSARIPLPGSLIHSVENRGFCMRRKKHCSPVEGRGRIRRLLLETLEDRRLLNIDWRNPVDHLDADGDRTIAPLDVLAVINEINRGQLLQLPPVRPSDAPYIDIDGDGLLSPLDALRVINAINSGIRSPRLLQEQSDLVVEQSIWVTTGQSHGSRTLQVEITAAWDPVAANSLLQDRLNIYVTNPDSMTTLLDRGRQGTSVFSLTKERAETVPGISTWDGRILSIDLTRLTTSNTAELRLQLLSQLAASGTQIAVLPMSNQVDSQRSIESLAFAPDQPTPVGPAAETSSWASVSNVEIITENWRYDAATQKIQLDARLFNRGPAIGRDTALVLNGLPSGMTSANASGTTPSGVPYWNLRTAIPRGGLGSQQRSDLFTIELENAPKTRFPIVPSIISGAMNRAPNLDPIPPIDVMPGSTVEIALQASDPDGDSIQFSTVGGSQLPKLSLSTGGVLTIQPTPAQLGTYQLTIQASDSILNDRETITVRVIPDPVGTTRVSGRIVNVDGTPIAGLRIEVGAVSGVTAADGSFRLDLGSGIPASETLRVRGELLTGPLKYPFIAEKLPFMLQHEIYAGYNNVIVRPIYLPTLNEGTSIDPVKDTRVERLLRSDEAPVAVDVGANTLFTQQGLPFTGSLSITEVPPSRTPASLPGQLFPNLVVTIQPGEMVFATPTPVTFPNRLNYPPGTILDLWSINPVTGEFDDVGDMRVSQDGKSIETIHGGIRNSSWHMPSLPAANPGNLSPSNHGSNPDPRGATPCMGGAGQFSPYTTNAGVAMSSEACLYTGALKEFHSTITYNSLGEDRGIELAYSSLRADPNPIIHFGMSNVNVGENQRIGARVSVFQNGTSFTLGDASSNLLWRVPPSPFGGPQVNVSMAVQADMRELPTGIYEYSVMYGPGQWNADQFSGTLFQSNSELLHVNTKSSPYGAGWGISGLQQLIESANGSILLVDGGLYELLFTRNRNQPDRYDSPKADFSTLIKTGAGWQRRLPDGTTYAFRGIDGRLMEVTDRVGNKTTYAYNSDGSLDSLTDPVGLVTRLDYIQGKLSRIVDPAGRATTLEHDSSGNLIKVTDPDGAARTWNYDGRNLMTGEIDANGNRELSYYDDFGRVSGATRKDGSEWRVRSSAVYGLNSIERITNENDPPFAVLSDEGNAILIDGRGEMTTYRSDRSGQLVNKRDRIGGSGSFAKDANDLIREVKDARGYSTTYKYDDRGNVSFIQDEINQPANIFADPFTRSGFDPNGQFGPRTWTSTSIAQADFNRDGFGDILVGYELARATIHFGNEAGKFPESQLLTEPANATDVLSSGSYSYAVDLNSDGWTDILHVSHGLVAKLNNGDGTWRDSAVSGITENANFTPQTAVFADFNNDGKIDLARALASTIVDEELQPRSTYKIFLGHGDGTFSAGQRLLGGFETTFNYYSHIETADLNQDNHDDVIVAAMGNGPAGELWPLGKLLVFPGRGDGTFGQATEIATGIETSSPYSLSFRVVDIDGDNDLDVLFADDWLLLNRGNGSFETKDISNGRSRIEAPLGASDTVLDLDNDGDLDIVRHATPFVSGSVALQTLINDGNQNFELVLNKAHSTSAPYYRSVIITDTNSDGVYEAQVLANSGFSTARLEPAPQEASSLDLGFGWIDKLYTGDFNLDGFDDLAIYGTDPSLQTGIWLLESKSAGGFEDPRNIYSGSTWQAEFVDMNRDGRQELLVLNGYTNDQNQFVNQLSIFVRQANGEYPKLTDLIINAIGSIFFATGDIDGDGDKDIIVSRQAETALLFRNNNSSFSQPIDLGFFLVAAQLSDINGDGRDDIYHPYSPNRIIGVRYADPNRIFLDEIETGFARTGGVTSGDIDGDGVNDLVSVQTTGMFGPTSYGRFLNRRNGFQAMDLLDAWRVNSYVPELRDIDNDGDLDILGYQRDSSTLNIYRNDGTGEYSDPVSFTVGTMTDQILGQRVIFSDIDRDGYDDLVFVEQNRYGQIQVRYNQLSNQGKHFEYEPTFNQVTKYTDDLGRVTVNQIDPSNGNLLTVTEVVGSLGGNDDRVTNYTYTPRGQISSMTNPAGVVTKYEYNALGRLVSITEAFGLPETAVTNFAYDAAGNLSQSIDPLGRVTRYRYDTANRLIETVQPDPDGAGPLTSPVSKVEYDKNGNPTQVIDPLNRSTQYTYDSLNRVATARDALQQTSQIRYDSASNVVATTDELGRQTVFAYDSRNRLVSQTDALGNTTKYAYSSDDQLTSIVDPLGRKTSFVYDARGRQTAKIDPLGKRYTTIYDAADQPIETIDELGRTTKFIYSRFGELTQQIDAMGGMSRAEYDAVGNRTALIDPILNKTTFTYDALNRLTHEANMLGKALTWKYDAVGNITEAIDRNGRIRKFQYDELHRNTHERWLDDSGSTIREMTWLYDAASQLLSARDPDSQWSFSYDALGRTVSSDNQGIPISPRVQFTYGYDANSNQTSRTDRIAGTQVGSIDRTFDNRNRVASIRQNSGGAVNRRVDFEYDKAGLFKGLTRFRDAAGQQQVAKTTYSYDAAARLQQIKHSSIDQVLATYDYTWDAADRITRIASPDGVANYTYDATDQLVGADHTIQQDEAYAYDLNGNRTLPGYQTGQNNRLLSDGLNNYSYDDHGNRILRIEISSGQRTEYGWDHRNRLTSVITKNSAGAVQSHTRYTYDVFDRRIRKSIDSDGAGPNTDTIKQYIHDGDHVAFEFDGSGNLTHRYLHGPVIDMVLADETAGGAIHWMLSDHLGTIRDIIDSSGVIRNHITYDSFGRILSQTNTALAPTFAYTGREWDAETGLYQYRARYYDAKAGLFISEDPIRFAADSRNLASYVENDVIRALDPTGLCPNGGGSLARTGQATKKSGKTPNPLSQQQVSPEYQAWRSNPNNAKAIEMINSLSPDGQKIENNIYHILGAGNL